MITIRNLFSAVSMGLVAAFGLAGDVSALDGRNPGSLLVYPEFDNRSGIVTLLTVTNVNLDQVDGTTKVEFRYIGKYGMSGQDLGCGESNFTNTLTGGDTLTLITNFHNPSHAQGYVYVFAKRVNDITGDDEPTVHNYLTGNVMTVSGLNHFDYSVNPISYRGIGNGVTTDLDGDGHLDMNGCEYGTNPDVILIPRFIGQGGPYQSELILIALSGGTAFETIVDFLIYNDNEEVFSSEYRFTCWDRVRILDISGIFHNGFLQNWTNHDAAEIVGVPGREAGWMRLQGAVANSTNTVIHDPSVYAVLVEKIGDMGASDLPFELGSRDNGELLPRSNLGDVDDVQCN